jgi:hypothetical protein
MPEVIRDFVTGRAKGPLDSVAGLTRAIILSTNNVKRYGDSGVPPLHGPIFSGPHLESI